MLINIKRVFLLGLILTKISSNLYSETKILFSFDFNQKNEPVCNELKTQIKGCINETYNEIIIGMYSFTSPEIVQFLINRKKECPNLKITIILDKFSTSMWGKAYILANNDIEVLIFDEKKFGDKIRKKGTTKGAVFDFNESIMHCKYAVFDKRIAWFGSYNWTQKADKTNIEFAAISNDIICIESFCKHFNSVKEYCIPYETWAKSNNCEKRNTNFLTKVEKISLIKKFTTFWKKQINKFYKKVKSIYS